MPFEDDVSNFMIFWSTVGPTSWEKTLESVSCAVKILEELRALALKNAFF